jgi:hypothetical protein
LIAFALLSVLLAVCGSSASSATSTPAENTGSVDALLSENVPPLVRHECKVTGEELRDALLYCPPLVPGGPVMSQNNLKTTAHGNSYQFNFVSPRLAGFDPDQPRSERHHLGHWRFAGGPAEDFRFTGIAPSGKVDAKPVTTFASEGVTVAVYERRARAYDIDEGHVFALWRFGGRRFEMSVHGFEHKKVLTEMTKALIAEMTGCSSGVGDAGEDCSLVFRPSRD